MALADQLGEPIDDRRRVIVDRRGNLLGQPSAVLAEKDDVGKGTADIDADPVPGHALFRGHPEAGRLPTYRRSVRPVARATQAFACSLRRGFVDCERLAA